MFTRLVIFFSVFCLFFVSFSDTVSAQLDQRCWSKEECIQQRMEFGMERAEATKGFYVGPDSIAACSKIRMVGGKKIETGFCLPAGKTESQITFGGKSEFAHIGDFISFMYRYGIAILGLFAVLVIIISGIQWTISAGNSSTIDAAKKRIGNAIVGLVIALLSYTILSTINPQLVNLRLPEIWLIHAVEEPIEFCDTLASSTFVAEFGPEGLSKEATREGKLSVYGSADFKTEGPRATCGFDYFYDGGGGETCVGLFCDHAEQICVKDQNSEPRKCLSGLAHGRISAQVSLFCQDLDRTSIADNIWLMAVCKNGEVKSVSDATTPKTDPEDKSQFFFFHNTVRQQALSACSSDGGAVGFYFAAEFNDEGTGGAFCIGGEDDIFAIAKNPSNSHDCSTNLSMITHEVALGEKLNCENGTDDELCLCAGVNRILAVGKEKVTANPEFTKFLFSDSDIQKGIVCNLHVTRTEFGRQDDDVNFSSCYGGFSVLDSPISEIVLKRKFDQKNQ